MKTHLSFFNHTTLRSVLLTLLLSVIISVGKAYAVDFTAAQIASGASSGHISVSSSYSTSNKKLCSSQSSVAAVSIANSANGDYNANYIEIQADEGYTISTLSLLEKANGTTAGTAAVVFWSGVAGATYTSYATFTMPSNGTTDCDGTTAISVPSGTRTVRLYRGPKLNTSTKTFSGSGTQIGGTSTFNVFSLSATAAASCSIDITPSLSYLPASILIGGTATPSVTGNTGSGAVSYEITSASPTGCATINASTGVVTGVAEGSITVKATIEASGDYCSGTATCNITISDIPCVAPTSVTISGTTAYTEEQTISLSAAYTDGTGSPSYQWYKGGTASGNIISGATSATFTKASCLPSDAGDYYCKVTLGADCSLFNSAPYSVTVTALPISAEPTITTQPAGATYEAGETVVPLSVVASGSGTLTYQWQKDGADISGETSSTYTPVASGTYACKVTNTETGAKPTTITSDEVVIVIKSNKYTLQGISGTSGTSTLTGDFYTTAACSQSVTASYDGVDYTKSVKFGGNASTCFSDYTDRMIRYDCKSTQTDFIVIAYNKNGSNKTLYLGDIKESEIGSANIVSSVTSVTALSAQVTTTTYSISSTTPASFYVSMNSTDVYIVQIIAEEKGTLLPIPGSVGYKLNFNKARIGVRSGSKAWLDDPEFEYYPNENVTPGSNTKIKFQDKGTHYIQFRCTQPSIVEIGVDGIGNGFFVADNKEATLNSISYPSSLGSGIHVAAVGAGLHYLVPNGSNMYFTSLNIKAEAVKVIFDANGGTIKGESTIEQYAAVGSNIALPHAVKNGQLLQGWYDAPIGGNKVSEPYTVSGAATLYAQYETCPSGGTLYKFELGTGLTNGAVGVNNVDFEFTTDNYLSSIFGGTLMTGGGGVANVQIVNNNAINLNNNSAYLKIDLDCELRDGDYFKTTIGSQNLYVNKSTSRSTVNSLPIGTLVQTLVPSSLVGVKTIYLWKGGGTQALTYFEIVRPQQTDITFVAPNAYNHYTTSIVAVKESPMPVIATLPARSGYVFSGYYDQPDGGGTQYYDGLGNSVRNWDKDVETQTLYAKWVEPCNAEPTLKKVIPLATIWDGQDVDMALIHLACDFDTTGISYSFVSASEAIPGCTYSYFDERIYIQGTPAVGNSSTITKTITFTMTNNCVSAPTYTVEATIRIYPAGQKPKVAFILTGTEKNSIAEGGNFNAYTAQSSCTDLLTYLGNYYDITCVNGYATKDVNEIEAYYSQYDLLVVTDFLNTGKGYTNAIGTMIDKKPILSFEAYVSSQPNWHIGSDPKDPKPKVYDMKVLCAGHAIFKNAKYLPSSTSVTQVVRADTTVHVIETPSGAGDAKGLQGFVINEAPDFIFLATVRDANNNRDLIVCCERQVVFPARLLIYGINFYEMGGLSDAGKIIMWQMMDYLLMTDETKVADCSLIFDNHDGDNLWSNPKNWAPGYNIVPTPYHPTRIEAECHVDTPDAHAGSVKVNKGTNAFGHTVDGKLIIKPYGGLTIAGMVAKVNDTRYASPTVIKAEDLLIEADASNNGAFVYGNKESDVRATVQYYSRGCNATTNPVWQYIGIPFQVSKTALGMFRDAWMCKWITGATAGLGGLWQWVLNEELLIPFEGYCITQENSITYTNAGKLLPPITTTIALDNRDDDGYAFAANSWTAPIKIQEMAAEDFTNAEQAIYIYHTGSYNDWTAAGSGAAISAKTGHAVTTPGQYAVIPIHSSPYLAGADSVIPAMQGFFVKVDNIDDDARLDLVYNRVVYDAKYFRTSTQPMRAPARRGVQTTDDKPEVMQLFLYSHSTADRVYLLSRPDFSDNFENGWDGRKIPGDAAAPMLAVVKEGGDMAVAAVPTLEERYLTFRAGADSVYTFSFNYDGEPIYLYDQVTRQATLINSANTYTFTANNKTAAQRFLITKNPPLMPTDLEMVETDGLFHFENYARQAIEVRIFDVQGRVVYTLNTNDEIVDIAPALPVGVYMARIKAGDTVKVVKLIGKEGAL